MPLADNFGRQAEALPLRELLGATTGFALDGDNERIVVGRTGGTTEVGALNPRSAFYQPITIHSAISGQGNVANPADNVSGTDINRPVRVFLFDREFVLERIYFTATTASTTLTVPIDVHLGTRNSTTTNSIFNNATTVGSQLVIPANSTAVGSGATSFNGSGTVTVSTTQFLSVYIQSTSHSGIQMYMQGYLKDT